MGTKILNFFTILQLPIKGLIHWNNWRWRGKSQGAVQDFYKSLYKETERWRPEQKLLNVSRITEEEQLWMERPFEEDAILKA